MQNQQIIVVVLGSTLKGIVAVTRGLFVGKAEHGMCWWCDTHSWLQYDGDLVTRTIRLMAASPWTGAFAADQSRAQKAQKAVQYCSIQHLAPCSSLFN